MQPQLPELAADAGAAAVAAALDEAGAVIVTDVLEPDLLQRLNEDVDPLVESADPDRPHINPTIAWFYGKRVRHVTGVASKSRVFAEEVLPHPFYADVCDAVLGAQCASVQLNVAHVMDRGPGAEAQFPHRDEDVWVHLPQPHPEVQLASVIALVDFRPEIGATFVAPGSHRWERTRVAKPEELVAVEMKAGSAVIYLGSTIHGGGANTSRDQWRRGMHISFVVGWLRTEENNTLSTPLEAARTLPRRSLELLGFGAHDALTDGGGYLGAVDLLDPADLIEEGKL